MRVIICGIGNNFTRNYHWISKKFEIVGLVDSNLGKQGETIRDFMIEGIDSIPSFSFDKILITPFVCEKLTQTIMNLGIPRERIIYLKDLQGIEVLPTEADSHDYGSSGDRVKLAFLCNGGAGNQFVLMNFIFSVSRHLADEPVDITVFASKSDELNGFLAHGQDFIHEIRPWSDSPQGLNYNVLVELDFFPFVLQETPAVKRLSPKLHELLCGWRAFACNAKVQYGRFHPDENRYVYNYARDNNKTNLTVLDVDGMLGIKEAFLWHPILFDTDILKNNNLKPYEYITVQRGATPGIDGDLSPKIWPIEHYNELIRLLHIVYPDKTIVQVGRSDNSGKLANVDVDLLDKTTWNELGHILKHAWIHIDG